MAKKAVATPEGGIEVELTLEELAQIEKDEAIWSANADTRILEEVKYNRSMAYIKEADSLFFEEQRGEVPSGTWVAKVEEIKTRFPKP